MKKFKSVEMYDKYLKNEFGFGLGEQRLWDFVKFVGGNDYTIYYVSEELEDDVVEMNNKYYWICVRSEGIRFVEVADYVYVYVYVCTHNEEEERTITMNKEVWTSIGKLNAQIKYSLVDEQVKQTLLETVKQLENALKGQTDND